MPDLSFSKFRECRTSSERAVFQKEMAFAGYYAFYGFVEEFRDALKAYADDGIAEMGSLLANARDCFPSPGRFSPSWDKLWDEFDGLYRAKNETLAEIPNMERDGEWQVLLDNPYSTQPVVCYPGLAFPEAVYMYAYFQKDLKPNEFLRLQKVAQRMVTTGRKEATIFPET